MTKYNSFKNIDTELARLQQEGEKQLEVIKNKYMTIKDNVNIGSLIFNVVTKNTISKISSKFRRKKKLTTKTT